MNADNAFCIGTTHKICEDYAMSGTSFVVLADGCSGSLYSDFGARILSVIAMTKMGEIQHLEEFDAAEAILLARPSIRILNLPVECLDATLLCSFSKNHSTEALCYGDGVIAIKVKEGPIYVVKIEYIDSYPFFINYLFDKTGRVRDWEQNHNKRIVSLSTISKDNEAYHVNELAEMIEPPPQNIDGIFNLVIEPFRVRVEILDIEKTEWIAIMSDGVHSFYKSVETETSKTNQTVPYSDILIELLAFKNFNGQFVQRRMNKFKKECLKNKWNHSDDVSLAVIYLGES